MNRFRDSVRYSENLLPSMQMQLSKNLKMFSEMFTPFLKFSSIFEHFDKKDDPHNLCISGIKDCKTLVYKNV